MLNTSNSYCNKIYFPKTSLFCKSNIGNISTYFSLQLVRLVRAYEHLASKKVYVLCCNNYKTCRDAPTYPNGSHPWKVPATCLPSNKYVQIYFSWLSVLKNCQKLNFGLSKNLTFAKFCLFVLLSALKYSYMCISKYTHYFFSMKY